jgi:hypothetical protein
MVAGLASGSRADLSLALDNDDALEAGPGVPLLQPVARGSLISHVASLPMIRQILEMI